MGFEEGIVVRGMVVRVTETEGEKCQTCTGEKIGGIAQENLTEVCLQVERGLETSGFT